MFIIGIVLICFFLPLTISMIRSAYLISEYPNTYHLINSLTEETFIVITVLFFILVLIGIFLVVFGWLKKRNKDALNSIVNSENQNFCNNCKINVSDKYLNCPICGKALKKKENGNKYGSHNN